MRVKSLVKAIQHSSRTNITVDFKKNNTILFVVTGGGKGVDKAIDILQQELEKVINSTYQNVYVILICFPREWHGHTEQISSS